MRGAPGTCARSSRQGTARRNRLTRLSAWWRFRDSHVNTTGYCAIVFLAVPRLLQVIPESGGATGPPQASTAQRSFPTSARAVALPRTCSATMVHQVARRPTPQCSASRVPGKKSSPSRVWLEKAPSAVAPAGLPSVRRTTRARLKPVVFENWSPLATDRMDRQSRREK